MSSATFFRHNYPAFLWAVLILVLTLSPAPALPEVKWIHIPHADKIVHAGLFGVQYFLLIRGLMKQQGAQGFYSRMVLRVIIIVILFGAATEILQAIVPTNRDADFFDWLADCAGTGMAYFVFGFWYRRKSISA